MNTTQSSVSDTRCHFWNLSVYLAGNNLSKCLQLEHFLGSQITIQSNLPPIINDDLQRCCSSTCVIDASGGVLYGARDRREWLELTTSSFCHSTDDKQLEYKHIMNVWVYSVNKLCIGFRSTSARSCRCMCVYQFCLLVFHTHGPVLYFAIHSLVFFTHAHMSHHKTSQH
jgi:hypothetical protein